MLKMLLGMVAAAFVIYHMSVTTTDRTQITRPNLHHPSEPPGSIEIRGRGGAWVVLPPGSPGQVLTISASGLPQWETP